MYPGEHAKTRWDEPAFIMATSGEVVTFRQYDDAANRMAQLYRAQGLQFKDHVAFFFENNLRMLECEGGAERSGLYYTCINSYLSPEEVAYIINDSQSRVVVTSKAKREVAMQLPALCPKVERWLMADIDGPDAPVRPTYAVLARDLGMPLTEVTNQLAWARRVFRAAVLDAIRAFCATDDQFRAEARDLLGVDL